MSSSTSSIAASAFLSEVDRQSRRSSKKENGNNSKHTNNHATPSLPLRRSRSDPTHTDDEPTMWQMEMEANDVNETSSKAQRRGSVEAELAVNGLDQEEDENESLTPPEEGAPSRTTSIRINRADSPTKDEEDLESALLNSSLPPTADPALYSSKHGPCKSGLSVGDFELLRVIGRGAYGKVFLVRRKLNGRHYAMKVVKKSEAIRKNVVQNMKAEREVLVAVRHPFIVNLRYAFQSDTKLYLVLDYIAGGELFTRLDASKDHSLPLKEVRFYAAQIILALEHLHSLNIIYRDLKPENCMLDAKGNLVLCDFGFAKEHINENDSGTRSFCGTLSYMSPELINGTGHGKGSDWWALGALLHEMILGSCPFNGANRKVLQEAILSAPLKLPKFLDVPTKNIITSLLTRPIHKRLGCGAGGAADLKKHAFFSGIDWIAMGKRQIQAPFIPTLTSEVDTVHFDVKFTSERAVDTPLSPAMMASILHGQGISPSTFHSANETFAEFSYARDHTPAPSPALRPAAAATASMMMDAPTRQRTGSSSSSTLASPRVLTGLPPAHPEFLELPKGGVNGGGERSLVSSVAATTSSHATVTSSSNLAAGTALALAKANNSPSPTSSASPTTPAADPDAWPIDEAAAAAAAAKVRKPKPVKGSPPMGAQNAATSTKQNSAPSANPNATANGKQSANSNNVKPKGDAKNQHPPQQQPKSQAQSGSQPPSHQPQNQRAKPQQGNNQPPNQPSQQKQPHQRPASGAPAKPSHATANVTQSATPSGPSAPAAAAKPIRSIRVLDAIAPAPAAANATSSTPSGNTPKPKLSATAAVFVPGGANNHARPQSAAAPQNKHQQQPAPLVAVSSATPSTTVPVPLSASTSNHTNASSTPSAAPATAPTPASSAFFSKPPPTQRKLGWLGAAAPAPPTPATTSVQQSVAAAHVPPAIPSHPTPAKTLTPTTTAVSIEKPVAGKSSGSSSTVSTSSRKPIPVPTVATAVAVPQQTNAPLGPPRWGIKATHTAISS